MRFGGEKVNNPHAMRLATSLGKFLVNFGYVELRSYAWVEKLARDPVVVELARDMPIARRIDLIQKQLRHSTISEGTRSASKTAWAKAKEISELRNNIAHSILVLGYNGDDHSGEPDLLGTINLKKGLSPNPKVDALVQQDRLEQTLDEMMELYRALDQLLDKVVSEAAI